MDKVRELVIEKMARGDYEIKPCPFCGKTPELMSKEFFEGLDKEYGRACISVECTGCKAELNDHTSDEHNYYVRAFIVVDKWNRRV